MAGVNKVLLVGNLGADPETTYTQGNGTPVARMRLAVSETWRDQEGQRQERTEWVNLVAWRQKAELVGQYLKKGSKIYVEGKLQTRSWDDRDGQKRYTTEVVVDEFQFLDQRPRGDGEHREEGDQATRRRSTRPPEAGRTEVADDLPF